MKSLLDRLLTLLETHLQFERDLRASYLNLAEREVVVVKEFYATKPDYPEPY